MTRFESRFEWFRPEVSIRGLILQLPAELLGQVGRGMDGSVLPG